MIDRREHNSGRIFRHCVERALQRTQHAAFGIGIRNEDCARWPGDSGPNLRAAVAEDYDYRIANLLEDADRTIEECFAVVDQQSFRSSHAAGSAAGQNNTGDSGTGTHFSSARKDSLVKMDFDSLRQSDSGARRMAIISATMETAISSGVIAPMSRPIGEKVFSNASRGMPSFSNSFTTPMTLRLLPIMAMYLALVR